MLDSATQQQLEQAYEICKLQAATDGAFSELLMQSWFQAAWEICASMVDLMPPQEIEEPICINPSNGLFRLSYQPTSPVEIYDGYTLITVIPANLILSPCTPALCCLCHPKAKYWIGAASCTVSARFVQAVARVFAYFVENRGDDPQRSAYGRALGDDVLANSGALSLLMPDLTYVL